MAKFSKEELPNNLILWYAEVDDCCYGIKKDTIYGRMIKRPLAKQTIVEKPAPSTPKPKPVASESITNSVQKKSTSSSNKTNSTTSKSKISSAQKKSASTNSKPNPVVQKSTANSIKKKNGLFNGWITNRPKKVEIIQTCDNCRFQNNPDQCSDMIHKKVCDSWQYRPIIQK